MTSHSDRARGLLARVSLTELNERALARALEPFPAAVRTLDALHLATIDFLGRQGEAIELASYDNRLLTVAQALGVPLAAL
jgi:predicted nucleic acid-binding protein